MRGNSSSFQRRQHTDADADADADASTATTAIIKSECVKHVPSPPCSVDPAYHRTKTDSSAVHVRKQHLLVKKGKKQNLLTGLAREKPKFFCSLIQQKRAPGNVLSYVQIIGREATYAYAHTNGYSGR